MSEADRTVAIAGGGIVGRTLAIALASQSHVTVRLLAGPPAAADERASAVSAAARRLLSRIGAWPAMAADAQEVREMVITDSAAGDVVRPQVLTFGEHDGGPTAHVVPNTVILAALKARCANLPIEETPERAVFFDEARRHVAIETDSGATHDAAVLIAADGRASRLRSIAGIATVTHDYRQAGITGTFAHELPHYGIATQHFLPNGPLAMLPLTGDRSSLVWTERPGFGETMARMDPMLVGYEVERAFGLSLGHITLDGPLQVYPLVNVLAQRWHAGRLALVGDAAHVIHPLAGQGLNLGLRDVGALAETLVDAHRNGEDLASALPRYERWRRADTTMMALVTAGLNSIFSTSSDLMRSLRSVGLNAVDRRDDLKALFAREAAGDEGELPRLLRGQAI